MIIKSTLPVWKRSGETFYFHRNEDASPETPPDIAVTLHVIQDALLLSLVSGAVFYQMGKVQPPCFHAFVSVNWKSGKLRKGQELLFNFGAVC